MSEQGSTSTEIALNVTRTRVTVLVFNLTVIALMLSIMAARSLSTDHSVTVHLTSSVALYIGFCLTILGIYVLLSSQNLDAQGLSRPVPFTLGSITSYLALSQTVTAFMHEYLLQFKMIQADSTGGYAMFARRTANARASTRGIGGSLVLNRL